MEFNITGREEALGFLASVAGLDEMQAEELYFEIKNSEVDSDEVLSHQFDDRFRCMDITGCRVFGMHLTASIDHCDSIMRLGLRNLREVLRRDTPLGNAIRDSGVCFHDSFSIMSLFDRRYDLRYELRERRESSLARVARKLIDDYRICGFLCTPMLKDYGQDVDSAPEFLQDLRGCLGDKGFVCEWGKHSSEASRCSQAYCVNFWTDISTVAPSTFEYSSNRDTLGKRNSRNVLRVMTKYALGRVFEPAAEHFLYLKSDSYVPPEQIEVKRID